MLDGVPVGSTNPITIHMDMDHELVANFTYKGAFELTIEVEGTGTTNPLPGIYTHNCCESVIVTAMETDQCWPFDHWMLDGVPVGSTNPITIHMDMDHTLIAVFEREIFWLTIDVKGPGTTDPLPGRYQLCCCCIAEVTAIEVDPCWGLDHWLLNGVPVGSDNPIAVHMDMDYTLVAVFELKTFWLTIETEGTGATDPVEGMYDYLCCENATVTAIETDQCWEFSHWMLDGVDVGSANPFTVHMDMDHTLTAVFEAPISIYTDKDSYSAGDTMHLGLDIMNPLDRSISVCVRIWLETPSGTPFPYLFECVELPAYFTYSNPSFDSIVLPSIPAGTYTWHLELVDPRTMTTLCEDTAEWEFS
jgi:hypothetical protein